MLNSSHCLSFVLFYIPQLKSHHILLWGEWKLSYKIRVKVVVPWVAETEKWLHVQNRIQS